MFGIRRGLKRGVNKLARRGKNDSPTKKEPTKGSASTASSTEPAAQTAAPKPRAPSPAAPTAAATAVEAAKAQAKTTEVPAAEPAPAPAAKSAAAPAAKPEPVPAAKPEPAPAAKPALSGIAAMIAAGAAAEQESIDLSVSYTSGPAAEAAAAAMAKRDMISHAEDGTPYWGALDNDSARSRAAGQTLVIDQWECIQCGTCVENTEQVFALPDDARAVVYRQEGPMELIQDAIDACPVTCIHWTDNPEQYEQLNDIEGHPIGDAA